MTISPNAGPTLSPRPVRPNDVISQFNLTCAGPDDLAVRPWISSTSGITSTTTTDAAPSPTFILDAWAQIVTNSIALAGSRRASRIKVQVELALSTATITPVFVDIGFDKSLPIEKGVLVAEVGICELYQFEFDVPSSAASCTVTLRTGERPGCYLNNFQIVVVSDESYVTDTDGFELTFDAFRNAGTPESNLLRKVFYYDRANPVTPDPSVGSWNCAVQGAPTLEWMVKANRRCVVFSDYRKDDDPGSINANGGGLPSLWHFVRESDYGDKSLLPASWTSERDASLDAEQHYPGRTLALLNHFPDLAVSRPFVSPYQFNDAPLLERHIAAWINAYKKPPNFLAVDYVTIGEGGGPITVVAETNRCWTPPADDDLSKRRFTTVGKTRDQVRADLVAAGTSVEVAISLYNFTDYDFDLVGGYARQGLIFDPFPAQAPGRLSATVRLAAADGSVICAGAFGTSGGSARAFWLFRNSNADPNTDKLLFVAVSAPLLGVSATTYANARWIAPSYAIASFINAKAGGDGLFDELFHQATDPPSLLPELQIRALTQITPVTARGLNDPHDMFVVLANA